VPAAAVIPAPIAYIKVAAVKKLVVGFRNKISKRHGLALFHPLSSGSSGRPRGFGPRPRRSPGGMDLGVGHRPLCSFFCSKGCP